MKYLDKLLKLLERIPKDKLLHFFFGYVITNIISVICYSVPSLRGLSQELSLFCVFLIAIFKEAFDYYYRHSEFDFADIYVTSFSALLYIVINIPIL